MLRCDVPFWRTKKKQPCTYTPRLLMVSRVLNILRLSLTPSTNVSSLSTRTVVVDITPFRYNAFLPAVLATALGLCGGQYERVNDTTLPVELAWMHALLLSFLDTEWHAYQDWLGHASSTKLLCVVDIVKAFGGGFVASPPCLRRARVLAEAFALFRAGHAGGSWDETREVLAEQMGLGVPTTNG